METGNNIKCDIIVIGSGPAGIAAALFSLQQGKDVVLISEHDSNTKNKSNEEIIESIHPGVITLLNHLKISSTFSDSILGTYSFINNGKETKSLNPYNDEVWEGFHISKSLFGKHLLEEAVKQKLKIIECEKIENIIIDKDHIIGVKTKSGINIFSKYVIDGSGKKKFLGKKLGFQEKFYSPTLIVWTGTSSTTKSNLFISNNAYFIPNKNGWTWIAQLKNKSFYWTKLSSKNNAKISAPEELSESKQTNISKVANVRWRIFRPLCIEGALICGDAAYLIDPAAGQGILNALSSGIKAGQTAVACIDNAEMENIILTEYDGWCLSQFEQKVSQLKEYYKQEKINVMTQTTKKEQINKS